MAIKDMTFNGLPYTILVRLSRTDSGFTDMLDDRNISALYLTSALGNIFPTLTIVYNDIADIILSKYKNDGLTNIDILIVEPFNDLHVSYTFTITSLNIISHNISSTIYTIEANHVLYPTLYNSCEFSTGGVPRAPTVIIDELIQEYIPSLHTPPEKASIAPTLFNHSDRLINYITPSRYSLKDNIDQLLLESISDKSGLYFLNFNLITSKLELISTFARFKQDISKGSVIDMTDKNIKIQSFEDYNKGGVPSRYKSEEVTLSLNDLELTDHSSFIDKCYLSKGKQLTYFDHTTRSWITNNVSIDDINHTLGGEQLPTLNLLNNVVEGAPVTPHENNLPNDFLNLSDGIYNHFMSSEILSFVNLGIFSRNAGDAFWVIVDKQDPLHERLNGVWIITKIRNQFDMANKSFYQDIHLIRANYYSNDQLQPSLEEDNTSLAGVKTRG